MSDRDFESGMSAGFVTATVIWILLGGLILVGVQSCTKAEMQDEATKRGAGEYYLDEHHQIQWRWTGKP